MADIIIPWSGNHASIPAGWARYTALDNKFPKASGAESAEATGGATTHTHTSPNHTHALNAHTHSFITSAYNGSAGNTDGGTNLSRKEHTHSGTSGAISGGTTAVTAVTYGSASSNPPNFELIFIKSVIKSIPADGIVMWDQTSAPNNTNYKVTDGNNSTVSLNGKYLKSADTSGNSGGTGGGTTNTHDISHTHTTNTHTQASSTSGGSSSITGQTNDSAGTESKDHTHLASFGASTQAINANADSLVTAETVEPAYYKLMAYQNKAGATQSMPLKSIVMSIDATLPGGYKICDGNNGTPNLTDKFVKITTSSGEIGNTGGSNTHVHASQNHTHTSTGGHTHGVTTGNSSGTGFNKVGSGVSDVPAHPHTHDASTSGSSSSSYATGATSADSSSNQPEYVILKYIQKISESGGGFLFLMM